jgi:hypothetical protein
MKVWIGDYCRWVGPYQIANFLEHFGVLERDRDAIGDWLNKTWVRDVCEWIHSKQKRIQYIKTDNWDSWSGDTTMAMLILPIMKDIKRMKHGYGCINDEDVPEELRSTNAPPKEDEWDWDDNAVKRYEWVLDEIIWAFEQILDENAEDQFHSGVMDHIWIPCEDNPNLKQMGHGPNHTHTFDVEGYKAFYKRVDNGTTLFGKYFRTFWR